MKHNFQLVRPQGFRAYCAECKRIIGVTINDPETKNAPYIYADLNGPAFKAYYCPDCVEKLSKNS